MCCCRYFLSSKILQLSHDAVREIKKNRGANSLNISPCFFLLIFYYLGGIFYIVWASFKTTFSGFPITTRRRKKEKRKVFPKGLNAIEEISAIPGAVRLPENRHSCMASAIVVFFSPRHVVFFLLFFLSIFWLSLPLLHTSRKVFNSINYCTLSAKRYFHFLLCFISPLFLSSYISSDLLLFFLFI